MRKIDARYEDPLDTIWIGVARALGFEVQRSGEVFASVADGVLRIGAPETLDPDDCLAQMVLHEVCHSLVQGHAGLDAPDWGLDNLGSDDLVREHACLRVQAALLRPLGLAVALAPTTAHRAFYDALGEPLGGDGEDVRLAREALARVTQEPWHPVLGEALEATATIAHLAAPHAPEGSLWSRVDPSAR